MEQGIYISQKYMLVLNEHSLAFRMKTPNSEDCSKLYRIELYLREVEAMVAFGDISANLNTR